MANPYGQPGSGSNSPANFNNEGSSQGMNQQMGMNNDGRSSSGAQLRRGVCKFFNSQKGFGFLLDNKAEELGGQEVFVHFTSIQSKNGFRSLAEGEEVEYEVTTGPKGFQAANVTGPGGRAVMGDPKGYMNDGRGGPGGKQQFMQFAPLMHAPYGMDPYVQQHPGAMYAASPYTSHVLYVPSGMHPGQQGQYMMQQGQMGQQQFSPQMGSGQFQGGRQGAMMPQGPPGAYGQPSSGSFGPVGGMASTMGNFAQPQQPGQSLFGNGMGSPTQQMSQSGSRGGFPGGAGGSNFGGFGSGLGLGQQGQGQEDGAQFGFNNGGGPQGQGNSDNAGGNNNNNSNGSSAFFGSNLLYSSGN